MSHPASDAVPRYVNRALSRLGLDVEAKQSLGGADPDSDPALFTEVIRQAAERVVRGAVSEYNLTPADARRLALDAATEAINGVGDGIRRVEPRRPDMDDAMAHSALVGGSAEISKYADKRMRRARLGVV